MINRSSGTPSDGFWYLLGRKRLLVWRVVWLIFFVLGLFLFVEGYRAIQAQLSPTSSEQGRAIASRFHKVVGERLSRGRVLAEEACRALEQRSGTSLFEYSTKELLPSLDADNLELLIVQGDSVGLWTFRYGRETLGDLQRLGAGYIQLFGHWYYVEHYDFSPWRAFVLVHIRSDYPVQNQYLTQAWDSSLGFLFGERVPLLEASCPALFEHTEQIERSLSDNRISLGFLFLFLSLLSFPSLFSPAHRMLWSFIGTFGALTLHWVCKSQGWLVNEFGEFFTPNIFAISEWVSSFGDLFYYSLFCLGVVLQARALMPLEELVAGGVRRSLGWMMTWLLGTLFLLQMLNGLTHQMVFNSTITLTPYSFAQMSPYALSAYFSLAVLGASLLIATIITVRLLNSLCLWKKGLIWLGVLLVNYFILYSHYHIRDFWCMNSFNVGLVVVVLSLHFRRDGRLFTGYYILLAVIYALSVCISLDHTAWEKNLSVREYIAESVGHERDFTLEFLFTQLSTRIRNDSTLHALFREPVSDVEVLNRYFRTQYHRNYLLGYDIQLTHCYPETNLFVDKKELNNCREFFSQKIKEFGQHLLGTNFYYLANKNGRISYIGVFSFPCGGRSSTLYVELDSKLPHYNWGYPELLVDKKYTHTMPLVGVSTGLYQNAELISQTGDYHFPIKLQPELRNMEKGEIRRLRRFSYTHFCKKLNDEMVAVVSEPVLKPIEFLGGLAYIGLVFIVVFNFILLPSHVLHIHSFFIYGLAGRIQRLILYMMLFYIPLSFISIQYILGTSLRSDDVMHLRDKIAVLLNEFDATQSDVLPSVLQDSVFANWELSRLSNRLYCDINLYDTLGWLVGSSRASIFQQQFLGRRMHALAWNRLHDQHASQFVQNECVGDMNYGSIYAPIYYNGRLAAYLNVPYFRSPSVVQHEYIHLVALILNTLLLFTCAKVLVMFHFTNRITRQLHMLRQGVENVSLNNSNRPLYYRGNDEIGALVASYNRMLAQLASSAEDLAQNERETAWKEMAKQIAHDIKNPLTPMKLGLQHLVLMKQQGREDWDERFDRYAQTLAEQIEALTQTADTFTHFATLTSGNAERTLVYDALQSSLALFESHREIAWRVSISSIEDVSVYIAPNNLQRVFNNLFSNAVQALTSHASPEISVDADLMGNRVRVRISDNGDGIDPSVQEKIFKVNFTTKSTGLGLGLAITANIVRSAGGEISFYTSVGEGTTFTVLLPVMSS